MPSPRVASSHFSLTPRLTWTITPPLPLSLAWAAFEEKNGAPDFETLRQSILSYRRSRTSAPDPEIGCSILAEPFFFDRDDWIPVPTDWNPNIVQGKTYDTAERSGARLWQAVHDRLAGYPAHPGLKPQVKEETPRYGADYLTRAPRVLRSRRPASDRPGSSPTRSACAGDGSLGHELESGTTYLSPPGPSIQGDLAVAGSKEPCER